MNPVFIEVGADVRYWEDANVNGIEDTDGKLIPFRKGNSWEPVIRLEDGQVMNWPEGMTADIHYKICDAGEYWLQDEIGKRVAKWAGYYVPNDFLCHGDDGYGDYIIFNVGPDGKIINYLSPAIEFACECEDDDECSKWRIEQHTKEPWRTGRHGCVVADEPVLEIGGSDDVEYYGGHLICESVTLRNARRIVACVNACAGIPTDDLESSLRLGLFHLAEFADEVVKQRDDLLAALEVLLRDYKVIYDIGDLEIQPALHQAHAAIAKVKEGEE